ncbi:MAG TPA: hypothetical protein VMV90_15915 [Rectinemataceae bacterium]|nr:hypothetical protein [Rectinemataceae bacterium]
MTTAPFCPNPLYDLLTRHAHAEPVRALGRGMQLSCGSVLNRFDRLSRQAVAHHAEIRFSFY